MKLNLGSGKKNLDGYINIDAVLHTKDTVVGDILNLKYKDNTVDEIYSEHVIEHLDRNELSRYFSEAYRMLKLGGKLIIVAPSIIKILDNFNDNKIGIDDLDNFLFALHLHTYDYHKQSIYKEKLERLCMENNFNIIRIYYQDRDFSSNEIVLEANK